MLPRVTRQLRGDTQPKAYHSEQHDIGKVTAQNVVSQGEREQRGSGGRRDHALHRNHRLSESVRSAQRALIRRGGGYEHEHRIWNDSGVSEPTEEREREETH
jgi:hypothetical protein